MTDSNAPYSNPNSATPAGASRTKGIVALVLGIVSLFGFFIPLLGLAGIAAIIMGILSRRSEPTAKNFALAGIITGVVGVILSVVSFVLNAILVAEILQQQGL